MSAITTSPTSVASDREALLAQARQDHAQYPQYDGYFDDWSLAHLAQDLRSKHGYLIAAKGTAVLLDPKRETIPFDMMPLARIWIPGDHVHAIYPSYVAEG
jgi:hypothetical protein